MKNIRKPVSFLSSFTDLGTKYSSGYHSDTVIHFICELLEQGKSAEEISNITNVSSSTIRRIKSGKIRKSISSQYNIEYSEKEKLSSNTVTIISGLYALGKMPSDIIREYGYIDDKINKNIAESIYYRRSYRSITDEYSDKW